ncbi:MAG: tetratricopeptide repeat protein [Candidatus Competibacteraceae bacterium]|nr:tetratricopeptide repeat protein [Candidatus Competibacteraceae bacterium]
MQPEAQAALRRVWLKQELARYQQHSQTSPDNAEVWWRIGQIYWELGDFEAALAAIDQTLALHPGERSLLLDRGAACLQLKRFDEALTAAQQVLALAAGDVEALLQQFDAFCGLQRSLEALAVSQRLLARADLSPNQRLRLLHSQASLQFQVNQREAALATIESALTLVPTDPDWRLRRARLLQRLRRHEESLAELDLLLVIPAVHLPASCVKARALAALWRFDEADVVLDALRARYPHTALEKEFEPWRLSDESPEDSLRKRYTGRGLYMIQTFEAQKECDWTDWDAMLSRMDDLLSDALRHGFVAGLEPHRLLSLPIDPAQQLAVARAQAAAVEALMAPVRQHLRIEWPAHVPRERLRVGYVSGDFRDHATAHLIRKLFQVHDHERFEIFGYSLRPGDDSRYWQDISQACSHFVELHDVSNADAAARIAADGIHILVDLHGYTRFARPEIFALRPAPVQVAFLGYPGSLGADFIPYLIADRMVLPEALRPFFTEQPLYLDCYQVNDDEQPITETGLTRAAVGLPEDAFVYCCFNNAYKIEPHVFAVWMRILRQSPGSVLWLLVDTLRAADHLRSAAEAAGVDPKRLIFAPRLSKAEHLGRHRLADVFLDTFTVNAHTTASDALWAGTPVLTRLGFTFQSRVCGSLLSALGLQELVVDSDAAFEERAVWLAANSDRLQTLRRQLNARRRENLPFATGRFAQQLEEIYGELWVRHLR